MMTKNKGTKRALLSSVLALLLCVSMLIGTTFAWFTDSVTSGKNRIVSGNLDIELDYSTDGKNWKTVDENTSVFNDSALWEPGHVETVALRIRNAGTLALKYNMSANVVSETGSVNVYGEAFRLSDHLLVEASEIQQAGTVGDIYMSLITGSREGMGGAVMNESQLNGNFVTDKALLAGESHVMAVRISMPETVGNEANHMTGEDAPVIEFGINLFATQYTYESDSFGNDYDADAANTVYVYSANDMNEALAKSGLIILGDNITYDAGETVEIPADTDVTIDLNGYALTNAVAGGAAFTNNGNATIMNGSIVNGVNSTRASHTIVNNGTLTVESGNIGTDDTAGAAIVNYGTAVINGGTFASKQENVKSDGLCAYAFINQSGTMTINDAVVNSETHGIFGAYNGEITVNGGSYTLWGNNGLGCYIVYSVAAGKVTLNDGSYVTITPRNSRYFFVYDNGNYFNEKAVEHGNIVLGEGVEIVLLTANNSVGSYDGLKTAMENGGIYYIADTVDVASNLEIKADTVLYGQNGSLNFTDNSKVTVAADQSLEIVGLTLDAGGEYSFDVDGNIVYDADTRRTVPLLNAKAGSTLTLGADTVVQDVVAKGSAVVQADGTAENRATVILEGATIKNCAGESGTVINVNKASDVYIEEGTVISGNASYNNNNHGIIRVYNAWDAANPSTVTINGGEISGNYYSGNGMIGLYYGKLIMNGGEIKDNSWFEDNQKHNGFYPVIYVHSNSQFVMNGGEISGNTVRYGALNCLNSALEPAIIINGGTVNNNTNTDNNTDAFAAVVIEEDGKIYKSVSISSDANVSGTVWDYYTDYYTLNDYLSKIN